jgi:uncharacterized protein (TIGR03083 family)
MTLPRDVVVPGLFAEYGDFGELLRSLSADDWRRPTRCEGWTAADVAAHVVGTLSDVVNLRLEGLGTPEVTERQVAERRGRTPGELADELEHSTKLGADVLGGFDEAAWDAPLSGGLQGTVGYGVETLWYDTYVHGDDIRVAAGRPSVAGDGLRPSLSHIAQSLTDRGWQPAVLDFGDLGRFAVSGGGDGARTISGDAMQFVLAATGRGDPSPFGLDHTVNIYG